MTIQTADRVLPFRGLGHTFTPGTSIEAALDESYLSGWNVRTEPLNVVTEGGITTMPRHQLILRDHPTHGTPDPIAPTGSAYTPVQNEELGAFAAAILDSSDLTVDSVGAIQDGRKVFITLASPETITYGEGEDVRRFITIATGHDGGMSTIVLPMDYRLACTNQLPGLRRKASAFYSVRHTGAGIMDKVGQARAALSISHKWNDALDADLRELLATPFSEKQFNTVVEGLFPIPEDASKAMTTRRETARADLWTTYRAETNAKVAGSAYGAVQTVTEFAQWTAGSDRTRLDRNLLHGHQDRFTAKAVSRILATV